MHAIAGEAGLKLLKRSVEHNPANASLENALGLALGGLGRPVEAAEHFRRALRIEPGFAPAQHNLAAALSSRRR